MGYVLMVRATKEPDALEQLEEWMHSTPEDMAARKQARRRAAAAALGVQVVTP